MGRPPRASFRFEKNKLVYRGRNLELWDGTVDGRTHLIKRFRNPRPSDWNEFALLARIKHPFLLKPSSAGILRDGSFCIGMPLDFVPERKVDSVDLFQSTVGLLSLIHSLQKKKIDVQWSADHLIYDTKAQRSFLAGVHPMKTNEKETLLQNLNQLCSFVAQQTGANHQLTRLLRKWSRRKEDQLPGCLQDLFSSASIRLDQTILIYEWLYSRELELVAGLYRLAEQGKGRTLLIRADAGEGKTTLMRQLYSDLLLRSAQNILFLPEKEERPFHSLKQLLRLIHQTCKPADPIPHELHEHEILAYCEKVFSQANAVTTILIDHFQNCDAFSQRTLVQIFQQARNWKVLFLTTSNHILSDNSEGMITITLQKPTFKQLDESVLIPLWQEKQRNIFFQTIYERTSGNPLFFVEYLTQAIRSRQESLQWNGNEWNFEQSTVPDFPAALLDFYWSSMPALTPSELQVLEVASLKGDLFEISGQDEPVAASLIDKQIIVEKEGRFRFQKPLVAEAIRKRLPLERFKSIHKTLAEDLSVHVESHSMIPLAHHYLKADEPSAALHWICRASQELGPAAEPAAINLFQELENLEKSFSPSERLLLFRTQADLFRKRGKFQHAAIAYRKAIEYVAGDSLLHFQMGLLLVECHILQEEIVAAQNALNQLDKLLKVVQNDGLLFRYHVAKGVCSHYRGPRNQEDFEKAFAYAEAISSDALLAHGYRRYAWLSLREGQLDEALKLARKALRFAKLSRDTEETGHCYKIFASIAWRKSRLDHAEKMMKKSIRAFQKTQNAFGCAGVWNLLGNVYLEKCRFHEAAHAFEKAVGLFGRLDHPREVSLAQFNMGLVYLELGKLKQAEKIFLRCRAIDKASGNKWFYAYDLRALGVYCILQGYPRKATRLLKRTLEICRELHAEGDLLQTTMILLFHYLDQGNYREAQPLIAYLQERIEQSNEPLTQAEIHHLLAYYFGFLNESQKALDHLEKSFAIARRIQHFKLIGKNQILGLIVKRSIPRRQDRELSKAVANFRKSKNQLEFADYLLKLYQAYPALLKEKSHLTRIRWMETLYRDLHIKPRYISVRKLLRTRFSDSSKEPVYDWWQSLLSIMSSPADLQQKLASVLKELSAEMRSSYTQIRYLGASGTYENVRVFSSNATNRLEELSLKIFEQTLRRRQPFCMDATMDPEISSHPWAISNQVGSVLAVPVKKQEDLLGVWYFERRKGEAVFSNSDLQKVSFFSTVCAPLLEKAIEEDSRSPQTAVTASSSFGGILGTSRPMVEVYDLVTKVAPLDVSVLIVGESGTGKELIARSIHRMSKRSDGPFVALNCSAIPETLIESELFGHTRGAFTGAVAARAGSIEQANKGTLFLDEIGDLSAAAQAKLLRVIQEREVQRIGETSVRKVDVRFLFATHKNLERMIKDGDYREDLYYRIAGYTLNLPPLRDRAEDIPLLVHHFADKYSREFGKDGTHFSGAALKMLAAYSWPGNIREMENVIQSMLVNADAGTVIDVDAIPRSVKTQQMHARAHGMSLEEGRELFDREFVLQALLRNDWNKSRTAKELKITRQGLISMIQRLHLQNH